MSSILQRIWRTTGQNMYRFIGQQYTNCSTFLFFTRFLHSDFKDGWTCMKLEKGQHKIDSWKIAFKVVLKLSSARKT